MADKEDQEPTTSAPVTKRQDAEKGRLVVHLLVVMFGITSWSIMNGLWLELPILVQHLPEGWTLPSYLTIIAQFGNLGPIIFSLLVYLFPRTKFEVPTSILIVMVLSLCALFYAFFWKETAKIGGDEYSVALLTLTFIQSVFAATTSQAYLALMSHIKARYMASLFLGMGLSGLLPALVAVAQGSGVVRCTSLNNQTEDLITSPMNMSVVYKTSYGMNTSQAVPNAVPNASATADNWKALSYEPTLTVQYFFMLLFALGMLSLFSLLMLLYDPSCKKEHVDTDEEENCKLMGQQRSANTANGAHRQNSVENGTNAEGTIQLQEKFENRIYSASEVKEAEESNNKEKEAEGSEEKQLSMAESWYLLGLLVWINAIQTSFLLAVQVYSSLPYGLNIYNGATKAENIVDPIACFIAMFVTAKCSRTISALTVLGTLLASYIITMAALSPEPVLVGHLSGGVLVIIFWILCTMVMVFTKVSIATVMRSQGRLSLIWSGACTQIGSFIGAVVAFVMVQYLGFFQDAPWCDRGDAIINSIVAP